MAAIAAALTGAERHAVPPWFGGLLDGLFAAAAAVVAQAVIALAGSLCTDLATKSVAVCAMAVALALRPYPGYQWVPILLGALAGALVLHAAGLRAEALPIRVSRPVSIAASLVFLLLVAVTALPRTATTALLGTVIRAGALVFGGGHVVLPLLQSLIRDRLIAAQDFFAGYGAAQAMPGPLNTFATFVGFANNSPLHGVAGALVATVLIFLPSFALIFAIAPVWNRIVALPRAAGALRGANASVVGLLAAVLYDPVLVSFGPNPARFAIALGAFGAIVLLRTAPWLVVVAAAALGALLRA
jgi:chromate transporter